MKNDEMTKLNVVMMFCKFLLAAMVVTLPIANAVDLDAEPTAEEKSLFDKMLEPIAKLYRFAKYGATIVAAIMFVVAGFAYMFSGSDIRKRENSKSILSYVLIGLVIIWGAPWAVKTFTG